MKELRVHVSESALRQIRIIVCSEAERYLPGLIYGRSGYLDGDGKPISEYEGWMVHRYIREEIAEQGDHICLVDGIEFVFFQGQLRSELEGKSLVFRNGQFLVE